MHILGAESFKDPLQPDLERCVTRRAWSLLRTFGAEVYEDVSIPAGENSDAETVSPDFELTLTQYLYSPDMNFRLLMSQFPHINGEVITDIGFVAMFTVELDAFDDPGESEQQIVFRQESHSDGPAVFVGDAEGYALQQISDDPKLLEIYDFLNNVETGCWIQYLRNGDAPINRMPASELAVGVERLLSEAAED